MDTLDIIDQANERSRWALGIMAPIAQHDAVEDDVKDAADRAASQIEDARELLRRLSDLTVKRTEPAQIED